MPESADLLAVARTLSTAGATTAGTDAELRRAVSSVYYAVFHRVAAAAAERFLGADQEGTAAYTILYRSFDHRHMKTVCEALRASTLKEKFRRQLGRPAVSQDMRGFAEIFSALQDARHLADYDPAALFLTTDVLSLMDEAETALAAFDRAPPQEQTDVLALLMLRVRE